MPHMRWDAFMFLVTIFALIADPISLAFNQVTHLACLLATPCQNAITTLT
jgi:hypothetical protein